MHILGNRQPLHNPIVYLFFFIRSCMPAARSFTLLLAAMAGSVVSSTTHHLFLFRFSFLMLICSLLIGLNSAQLSEGFYSETCPTALSIIKTFVINAVKSEARMGASLLRLHFHDYFVNVHILFLLLLFPPFSKLIFIGLHSHKSNTLYKFTSSRAT